MFHATDDARLWKSQPDSEVQPSGSGAEGKHVDGTTIHIAHPYRFQHTTQPLVVPAASIPIIESHRATFAPT